MPDETTISTTLLAVGIVCIIIFSVIIVWLIIWCEKRRKASFRFRPNKAKTPKQANFLPVNTNESISNNDSLPNMEIWYLEENSPVFPETPGDKEEEAEDLMNIPIQQQIAAILGSFPDITDYISLCDESDDDSVDIDRESASNATINNDASAPPLICNWNESDIDDCPSFTKQNNHNSSDNILINIKNTDTTFPGLNDSDNVKNDTEVLKSALSESIFAQSSKNIDSDQNKDLILVQHNNSVIDPDKDDDTIMLLETTI